MDIKQTSKRHIFGNVTNDDINLHKDNVTVRDVSFDIYCLQEADDGYYYSSDEYMVVYLKDLSLYLTIELEINYSFVQAYDGGDYWTPPSYEIVHEDLDIEIVRVMVEDEEWDEVGVDFQTDSLYIKLCKFVEDYIFQNL